MSISKIKLNSKINFEPIIIPKKTVYQLISLLEGQETTIKICNVKSKIKFEFDNSILVSKLIDGKFPNYIQVIPVNNKKGGVGNLFFPSTSLVRSSLKQVDAGMIEPQYASGFSQSAVETPVSSSVPSSQGFVDPMPQEVATPVLQESYGWLGKSASDDDNQSNVGQIS